MDKSLLKRIGCLVGGLAFASAVYCAVVWLTTADFVDNPAWLVEVSEDGLITLDTYQGKVVAPLSGVHWNQSPGVLSKAQELIADAQRDKVAFATTRDGKLKIWYPSVAGADYLNEQLISLFDNFATPKPK